MKLQFNIASEMNEILQSSLVKSASVVEQKTSKNYDEISSHIINLSEMAIELDNRGMNKTASSLRKTARMFLDSVEINSQAYKIAELYGLV
jgi:hypothetical protein